MDLIMAILVLVAVAPSGSLSVLAVRAVEGAVSSAENDNRPMRIAMRLIQIMHDNGGRDHPTLEQFEQEIAKALAEEPTASRHSPMRDELARNLQASEIRARKALTTSHNSTPAPAAQGEDARAQLIEAVVLQLDMAHGREIIELNAQEITDIIISQTHDLRAEITRLSRELEEARRQNADNAARYHEALEHLRGTNVEEGFEKGLGILVVQLAETRRELDEARAALEPFGLYAKLHGDDHELVTPALGITLGDCRRAHRLLNSPERETT